MVTLRVSACIAAAIVLQNLKLSLVSDNFYDYTEFTSSISGFRNFTNDIRGVLNLELKKKGENNPIKDSPDIIIELI